MKKRLSLSSFTASQVSELIVDKTLLMRQPMKVVQHTPKYLELQAQNRRTVRLGFLFGLPACIIGTALLYVYRNQWGNLPHVSSIPLSGGIVLIGGGLILLLGVSTLTVMSLGCQFDRECNQFRLTYRTLLWKRTIRRSLPEIRQVFIKQGKDIEGDPIYHIVLVMKSGETIQIPQGFHSPEEQQLYEVVEQISGFLGL
jgi:hypothetical protein